MFQLMILVFHEQGIENHYSEQKMEMPMQTPPAFAMQMADPSQRPLLLELLRP